MMVEDSAPQSKPRIGGFFGKQPGLIARCATPLANCRSVDAGPSRQLSQRAAARSQHHAQQRIFAVVDISRYPTLSSSPAVWVTVTQGGGDNSADAVAAHGSSAFLAKENVKCGVSPWAISFQRRSVLVARSRVDGLRNHRGVRS